MFSELDTLTTYHLKKDHDHRYVMLGIPGIGVGNGFETIRSNNLRSSE
jgi:hypothetical protein